RNNPMAHPDVAQDFSRRVLDVTDAWRTADISHLAGDPQALRNLIDARKLELQKALDDFTSTNGMARVRVDSLDEVSMGGARAFQEGDRIVLRDSDILNPGKASEFNAILYHELGHSSQHSLMIRKAAESLELDAVQTAQKLERLQQ